MALGPTRFETSATIDILECISRRLLITMLALHSAVAPAFTAPLSAFAPQRAASVRMALETM